MKISILGGGISGLSAAWFLLKRYPAARIVLFEKQDRLGGAIETETVDGFSFEWGPRTFQRARCTELLGLIRELGLEGDLLFSDPAAKARYVLHRGELRTITSLWPQLLRAAAQDLMTPKGPGNEESIYEFACRRFGHKAAELFFDPLAKGVFAGDIRKLSLDACFPFFREWERSNRSIVKTILLQKKKPGGLFTLRGGMGRLIDALAKMPIEIQTGVAVEKIDPDAWVVSALPGPEIARLCGVGLPLPNESISVVTMGYSGDVLSKKGYGYLVPSMEKEALLGQIWDSAVFPEAGQTKVTSMVRGESPAQIALDAMRRHLGVFVRPDAIGVKTAWIPQYEIGHANRIKAFEAEVRMRYPKLKLIGNYFEGASVEACIRKASQLSMLHPAEERGAVDVGSG